MDPEEFARNVTHRMAHGPAADRMEASRFDVLHGRRDQSKDTAARVIERDLLARPGAVRPEDPWAVREGLADAPGRRRPRRQASRATARIVATGPRGT